MIMDEKIASRAVEARVVLNNGVEEVGFFEGENLLLLPATRKYFWQKPTLKIIEIYGENNEKLYWWHASLDVAVNRE
ncbi:hypothetical protein SAMN05446037_1001414 [Anaerovirgula multivorans]|uniref:Uncharacterized protein n=1 Tax=Anaerovirgula multivorans TaxID=312168 RepID=A0A239A9T2_9FIRM|nr:hypothetical protein [Anaerovirgula multivorans]SNR91838.1 hypothetical protein SAMN05446037_1001414 [Anaerovirgula multivorans]